MRRNNFTDDGPVGPPMGQSPARPSVSLFLVMRGLLIQKVKNARMDGGNACGSNMRTWA
jgi:hypothetical protein